MACPGLPWAHTSGVTALKIIPGISVELILFLELHRATCRAQASSGRTLMSIWPGEKITFVFNLASKSHPRSRCGTWAHIESCVSFSPFHSPKFGGMAVVGVFLQPTLTYFHEIVLAIGSLTQSK